MLNALYITGEHCEERYARFIPRKVLTHGSSYERVSWRVYVLYGSSNKPRNFRSDIHVESLKFLCLIGSLPGSHLEDVPFAYRDSESYLGKDRFLSV